MGIILPRVVLAHTPTVEAFEIASPKVLKQLSRQRHLALRDADLPVILDYFQRPEVQARRKAVGLSAPTDVELEYLAQARSDHCNHNTFRGRFHYRDMGTGESFILDNPFKACISAPTREIAKQKPWVVSVLWDNAGVGQLDDEFSYVIKGETHNSPSNLEAYGGSLTGIVGVYRDPLGTGKGARLIGGMYGFCVGPRDYSRAAQTPAAPPAASGWGHRRRQGRRQQERGAHRQWHACTSMLLTWASAWCLWARWDCCPREIKGEPGADKKSLSRRPDRYLRRPGGQGWDSRGDRFVRGLVCRYPGGPRPDR